MMYGKKSILMILFFLFVGSSNLDARRAKRTPTAEQIWNDALKANNDTDYNTIHKRKRYKSKRRKYKKRYRSKKKSNTVKSTIDVTFSSEKKLQKSLFALGFYQGAIDGEVNAAETRQAIKTMNQAYRNEDTTFLNAQVKDTLIYLADLYRYDTYLSSEKRDEKTKNIKLQTALKVFGFYTDEIDGLVGSGTRSSIAQYKKENDLTQGEKLDFEEEYQLVSTATELNQKNIKEAKERLKLPGKSEERSVIETQDKQIESAETKAPEDRFAADQEEQEKPTMIEGFFAEEEKPSIGNQEDQIKSVPNNTTEEKPEEEQEEQAKPTIAEDVSSAEETVSPDTTQEMADDAGVTREECLTLVASFDEAVLEGDRDKFGDLESTANILMYMCNIQKTKTGGIAETMKKLKGE